MVVLAIDPGSKKSGVALVSSDAGILRRAIVPVEKLKEYCREFVQGTAVDAVIVGGSTGSKAVCAAVSEALGVQPVTVDERYTTERAKMRYFSDNPPRGWRRWLPSGLLYPPVPFDDYAAVIMAEDYIESIIR
ncbi:pre-16S rRNA-processing nuclease YqgF [bacterium]|nr:pre-16S rRNA-processing nuclease YqgF [bacterium]